MTYSARGFQLVKRGSHNCCKCLGSKGKVGKFIGQIKDGKRSKVTNNVRTKVEVSCVWVLGKRRCGGGGEEEGKGEKVGRGEEGRTTKGDRWGDLQIKWDAWLWRGKHNSMRG